MTIPSQVPISTRVLYSLNTEEKEKMFLVRISSFVLRQTRKQVRDLELWIGFQMPTCFFGGDRTCGIILLCSALGGGYNPTRFRGDLLTSNVKKFKKFGWVFTEICKFQNFCCPWLADGNVCK